MEACGFTIFRLVCREHHQELFALGCDVIVPVKSYCDETFNRQCLLATETKFRFCIDIDSL